MNKSLSMLLLTGLALPVFAQETKFSVEGHAAILGATGDYKKMVDKGQGLTLGGAFTIQPTSDYAFRLFGDAHVLKGKDGTGLSGARFSYGIDAIRTAGKTRYFLGVLGMRWGQKVEDATIQEFVDNFQSGATVKNVNNSGKGTKLGVRVGVEYDVMSNLAVSASFTQSEFNKIYQPSWVNLGVRYRFGLN